MSERDEPDRIRMTIDSRSDQVALVARCIRVLSAAWLGERAAHEIELAACEVINNVIEHAYDMQPGRHVVIDWSRLDSEVRIDVHDWGKPVPPDVLTGSLPNVDRRDVPNLPEGGFGIGLFKALSDRIDYRTDDDGRNTLSLFRSRGAGAEELPE